MNKKLYLIVNPYAGRMRLQKELLSLICYYSEQGYMTTVVPTTRGIVGWAQEYASDADMVVCSGGDGTLNGVITGLMSLQQRPPLGYIPSGSTNDFATSLGLSQDMLTAARATVEGTPRPLDVGAFNDRYFSYIASFGAFTDSSYGTPQEMKNALGHMAYILEGMKDIGNIKPRHVCLETAEGETYEDDYIFGAVSNSTSIAGIVRLDEGFVDMADGQLEVMLVKYPRDFSELSRIALSIQTREYDPGMIKFFHSGAVTVTTDEELPWSLDGEYDPGASEIQIRNCYHAITLVS